MGDCLDAGAAMMGRRAAPGCAGTETVTMVVCRTLDEVLAAADADSASMPPLTQAQVNLAYAILTHRQLAGRESSR